MHFVQSDKVVWMAAKWQKVLGAIGLSALVAVQAHAIPVLQIYLEGATYDAASESWLANFSAGGTLRLWTIGDVSSKGTIYDVKLAVAYDADDSPTITLTPATTGGYGGFTDPSLPIAPAYLRTVTDGSSPKLYDGSSLPSHGEYGSGVAWQEFALGDFTLKDSPMADFITSFPSATSSHDTGQINVYDITVTGTDFVHFDLYDHTVSFTKGRAKTTSSTKSWFAPFSHDGEGHSVPDGGPTGMLLGLSLAGLGWLNRRRLLGGRA